MRVAASAEKALVNRSSPRRPDSFRTQFIGPNRHHANPAPIDRQALLPVAYLVELGPGRKLRPHFHVANQFQIFVGGTGTIGRHPTWAGVGHFSGPHTVYGPIVNRGDDNISYMTLRNAWDGGAQYIPERVDTLRADRGRRREMVFDTIAALDQDEVGALTEPSMLTGIPLQQDGLGAWVYRLPAGASATGPRPSEGAGQYWLVLGGTMIDENEGEVKRLSCVFLSPDEAAFEARAGAGGLEIMVVQFPIVARH